jgi:hypothetical protein
MGLRWTGLDEYREALAAFPEVAAGEAAVQVERAAESAYETIYARYPVVTGRLKAGLSRRDVTTDAMRPRWQVTNDVIYARAWESGGMTTAGPSAPGKLFVPTMQRQRRTLRGELIEIVKTGAERVTVDE